MYYTSPGNNNCFKNLWPSINLVDMFRCAGKLVLGISVKRITTQKIWVTHCASISKMTLPEDTIFSCGVYLYCANLCPGKQCKIIMMYKGSNVCLIDRFLDDIFRSPSVYLNVDCGFLLELVILIAGATSSQNCCLREFRYVYLGAESLMLMTALLRWCHTLSAFIRW